ncbi:hypothetical protein QUB05_09390 [Microcoleus sp. F10-C6]|uniref:hypothetical protein n=1 Tax=unclassified Microcoleus TaxID=2642155 RepID=UPI002FD084C3
METNDISFQQLPSESQPENSTAEELDALELDAIAGGCSDGADRARAAGIRVMTTNSPGPEFRGPSMNLIEAATRAFGNRQ